MSLLHSFAVMSGGEGRESGGAAFRERETCEPGWLSMPSFRLPVRFMEGCVVVSLPPEVDYGNAETVSHTLLAVLNQGAAGLVADMTATEFSDVSGVHAVVFAHNRAEELGCWVRVVAPHPAVRRVFSLTGAESLIGIYASLDDALPRARENTARRADLTVALARLVPRQPRYPELIPPWEVALTHDLAPEERTPGLITRVRTARDHSRATRFQMSAMCGRLAITCADFAAVHERLAQRRPDKAALFLSVSQAARDRATAYQRLAANTGSTQP